MEEEKNLQQAMNVYESLCSMLDEREWHCQKDPEKLRVKCSARGDDLPMEIILDVKPKQQVLLMLSFLPFTVPEEKRIDLAIAVSFVNNMLADGCFDYDFRSGDIIFRVTNSFRDSQISKDAFEFLLMYSFHVIDDFNDKFFMIAKGMLSLEQFMEGAGK